MKLRTNFDLAQFIKAVESCTKDVFFVTMEGDRLNLKSALSRFLFILMQDKQELIGQGTLQCDDPRDEALLRDYVLG